MSPELKRLRWRPWLDHYENSNSLELALPLWENAIDLVADGVGPRDRPEDVGLLLWTWPTSSNTTIKPWVELIKSIRDRSLEKAGLNSTFHKSG